MLLLALAAYRDDRPAVSAPACLHWSVAFSANVPSCMVDSIDFPVDRDGVHYVQRQAAIVRQGQTITFRFAIEGTGSLKPTADPDTPAQVRLYMQRRGDRMTADMPHHRWWSTGAAGSVVLKNGEHVLVVQVSPDQWSSVFGANGSTVPDHFRAAVDNLGVFGFTFGGMFFGHGVYATGGPVKFVLKEFSVR